ncbi:MAG: EAL domain-containing protein [Acidobacteriota bacterium]|nr:EAL domain-containing protein [Acidobacteriota bacterium]
MTERSDREMNRLRTRYLQLRAALRDPTTGLFGYSLHFDRVRAMLTERQRIGVLWVSLRDEGMVEAVYGWQAYDDLVAEAAAALEGSVGETLPDGCLVATSGVHADAFTVFVPADPEGRELDAATLAALATALDRVLGQRLRDTFERRGPLAGHVRVGAALLVDNPFHRFERRVHHALDEARRLAERPQESERLAWLGEVHRLVRERDVRSLFQPIVDLESGEVVGVEAFARGPSGSPLRFPRVMFSLSRQAGLSGELDRICRETAITQLGESAETKRPPLVFLNTAAESLLDPDWTSSRALETLEAAGLAPSMLVLEVAEREIGLAPELYREVLDRLRGAGYRLSLDDVGSGARTVMLVEKLRPEFMKLDVSLLKDVAESRLSLELIRSLVGLAGRAEARLVAEGVETEEQRRMLLGCGASWGQGYLFGRELSLRGAAAAPRDDQGGRS